MKLYLRLLVLPFLVFALSALPAAATTYMMMSDEDLADQAAAVVEVRVMGVEYAPVTGTLPATDYLVEVSRVLKGDLPGSTVMVRVPGGVNPEGMGLKIWGAPEFGEGEEAILFLRPAQDGTYRVLHLMLGAFHKRTVAGRAVAVRELGEAHAVGEKSGKAADVIRDFDRFSEWVSNRALGVEGDADYVVRKPAGLEKALAAATEKFSYLTPSSGNPIRWFRFDRSQRVDWRVHTGGQPGLTEAETIAAFRDALTAWNSDPGSNIQYNYAGTTTAGGGLVRTDNVNTILFDDPFRDNPDEAVEGTFTCRGGGVIAIGGPWFFRSTQGYRGRQYHEAGEADIITNDGTLCLFRNNPTVAREVFAHELGHTLGLGHSDEFDALMYPTAHDDLRGASLDADDRAGVRELYFGNSPTPGGPSNLVAPAKLTAKAASSTTVNLTWRDKARGEESYSIEARKKGGKWVEVLNVPADVTSAVVEDLITGATYAFRVRAMGGGSASGYSNVVNLVLPRRR